MKQTGQTREKTEDTRENGSSTSYCGVLQECLISYEASEHTEAKNRTRRDQSSSDKIQTTFKKGNPDYEEMAGTKGGKISQKPEPLS